jgi:uncharacterized protein (DUF697 family)
MSEMSHLLHLAKELVEVLDRQAESSLPQEIADVVKLHAKLAVGSALIPIPGADVAAGAATIWTMYLRINDKIGMKFGESLLKTIASGVATNLASFAAMSAVGSFLKCIPGLGTIAGAAVMAASLYAITLTSGYIYLKALTSMLRDKKGAISDEELETQVKEYMQNNQREIKDFMNEAKSGYKS